MIEFIMQCLGLDSSRLPEGSQASLHLRHGPESWQVFLLIAFIIAAIAGIVYLYKNEQSKCSKTWRGVMMSLRIAIVLLIILLIMAPEVDIQKKQIHEPRILILVDDSLSMTMRDRYRDPKSKKAVLDFLSKSEIDFSNSKPSRIELVNQLFLEDKAAFVRSLSEKGRVLVMSYAESLSLRESVGAEDPKDLDANQQIEQGGPAPPLDAKGGASNIGRALREAVHSIAGDTVSAIILLSDGQDTSKEDPKHIAEQLEQKNIPVYSIPLGDPSPPQNIRVSESWAPESVPLEDPFEIQASLQIQNIEGEIEVQLLERKENDTEDTLITTQTLVLKKDEPNPTFSFNHKAKKSGTYHYTIKTPVQDIELLDKDNESSVTVEVMEEKTKLLLIGSAPSWDYRIIRDIFIRDKTIDLSCWLQSLEGSKVKQEGNVVIDKFPTEKDELYQYDAILMLDPDLKKFKSEWFTIVKDFVGKHHGGLLWQSHLKHTPQISRYQHTKELIEILPVHFNSGAIQANLRKAWTRSWPVKITNAGLDHPMLRLNHDPQMNAKQWKSMPGIYWASSVDGVKPGAEVLVEHSNPSLKTQHGRLPLLVTGHYGSGKVIYLGFSNTWRWRQAGEKVQEQFWIQAVRDLSSGRQLRGQGRGQLSTDRDTYGTGESILVKARLSNEQYEPLVQDRVQAIITAGENEKAITLLPGKRKGVYETSLTARHIGSNEIKLRLEDSNGNEQILKRRINVELPNIEFANPQLNLNYLTQLSKLSGGEVIPISQSRNLSEIIPDRRESIMIKGKPLPLWDNQRILFLIVILLGVEWTLRKRFQLI